MKKKIFKKERIVKKFSLLQKIRKLNKKQLQVQNFFKKLIILESIKLIKDY